jgi:hypothetical protein
VITGDYAVVLNSGVCNDTSDCITVNLSSLSEQSALGSIFVYPNPAKDFIVIKVPAEYIGKPVALFNLHGGLMQTNELTSEISSINLAPLATGMYLLMVGEERFQLIVEQ